MSAKPKQNPEKLLTDYARKRRDDAASLPAMPDSMRDNLHAQVARTYGGDSKTALLLHWVREFWPRLAFGGAVCVFTVLGAILWQFQNAESFKQTTLALKDTSKPPTLDLADKQGAVALTAAESLKKKTEAFSLPTQPMQMETAPDNNLRSAEFKEDKSPLSPEPARSASPRLNSIRAPLASSAIRSFQIETASSEGLSSTNQGMPLGVAGAGIGGIRLYYTQVDRNVRFRRNFNSPPYPDILRTFEACIQGTNLSVIDADGSIYEGIVRQVDTSMARSSSTPLPLDIAASSPMIKTKNSPESAEALNRPMAQATTSGPELEFYFRVVGPNRSLNRQVVFTGNMRRGRLEGEARIGGTNQFKVEAIPVSK